MSVTAARYLRFSAGLIAVVNDLLVAPDRHTELAAQLAGIRRRVGEQAISADQLSTAQLLREAAALRSEISTLVTESSSGFRPFHAGQVDLWRFLRLTALPVPRKRNGLGFPNVQ